MLNKANGDYLSGKSTDSLLQLDNLLNRLGVGSTNAHLQSIIKNNVESNVAKTQKGNESSKFDEHIKNEQNVAGKGTSGVSTQKGTVVYS